LSGGLDFTNSSFSPQVIHPAGNGIGYFSPAMFEALGFGVVVVDADTHRIVYANQKIHGIGGYPAGMLVGRACHGVLCPGAGGRCPVTDEGRSVENSEEILIRADGTRLPIIKTAVPITLRDRNYLIASIVDNSQRKQIQSELRKANESLQKEMIRRKRIQDRIEHLAYHDHLTGLANRLLFRDELDHAVSLSRRMGKQLAIMFLDLDGFKTINDTMGHATGDQLLKGVSSRLVAIVRKSDVVARIGGDEFVIMITNQRHAESMKLVAEKILNSFRDPFRLNGRDYYLTTSIGVAIYPSDGENAETLLKNADIAMYQAKQKGRNQYFFCPSLTKNEGAEGMESSGRGYEMIDRTERKSCYRAERHRHGMESLVFKPCREGSIL